MSTYWGVACLDCNVELGVTGNHYEKEAVRLAARASELAVAARAAPGLSLDVEELGFPRSENGAVSLDWFAQHAGHRISARNEYGAVPEQCWEYVKCSHCESRPQCTLSAGHKGKHSVKKRRSP